MAGGISLNNYNAYCDLVSDVVGWDNSTPTSMFIRNFTGHTFSETVLDGDRLMSKLKNILTLERVKLQVR